MLRALQRVIARVLRGRRLLLSSRHATRQEAVPVVTAAAWSGAKAPRTEAPARLHPQEAHALAHHFGANEKISRKRKRVIILFLCLSTTWLTRFRFVWGLQFDGCENMHFGGCGGGGAPGCASMLPPAPSASQPEVVQRQGSRQKKGTLALPTQGVAGRRRRAGAWVQASALCACGRGRTCPSSADCMLSICEKRCVYCEPVSAPRM